MFLFKVVNILMFFITLPNLYCLPLKAKSVDKVLHSNPRYLDSILSKCILKFKLKCFFSPPTSEAGVRFPARLQVGKLVVVCRWSAVYSTEP